MFRATGAGKVDVDSKYTSPGLLKALLYNFDFDDMASPVLKPAHIEFLRKSAIPLLAGDRGHMWIRGSASKVGSGQYNMTLSRARVQRVGAFLRAAGVADKQMQLDAVGEDLSNSHASDDERDRGVAFIILPKRKSEPPPARIVPPKPLVSDQFRIALLTAVSASFAAKAAKYLKVKVGAGLAVDGMFFIIWDTTNSLSCIYLYAGVGIGVGLALPASGTTHGDWNSFKTSTPISCTQFEGFTGFTTAGAGPYSVNWINMCGTPEGVDNVYERISTGTTLGAGASSTVGDLILLEGPLPFSGP